MQVHTAFVRTLLHAVQQVVHGGSFTCTGDASEAHVFENVQVRFEDEGKPGGVDGRDHQVKEGGRLAVLKFWHYLLPLHKIKGLEIHI